MPQLRAVLYSYDLGPEKELALVAAALARRGWAAVQLPAQQRADAEARFDPEPNLVVTGLSALGKAEEGELALGEAATKRGIPWVILADTHESFLRPEAKGRIASATLIVASPEEINAAKKFGYSGVISHTPPTWQDRWEIGEPKRVSGLSTVYVAGVKNSEITSALIRAVIEGASMAYGRGWALIFRPHPSEFTGLPDEEKARRGTERAKALSSAPYVLAREISENEALLAADDCFFTGGSGAIITAAMNRMRQAYFETEAVSAYMTKQIGKPRWWPIEAGVARVVANPADISAFLRLTRGGRELTALYDRQEAAYPRPSPGEKSADSIAELLENLVAARARA